MKLKDSYHPYAIITIIFWSLAYSFTKLALMHFTAFSLGFLRYLTASVTLIIISLFIKIEIPKRKDIPMFIAAGASGFFLYMVTFNKGAESVSSATGSVIIATAPLITALIARFIYNEKLSAYQWAGIIIQFSGVLILTLMDGIFSINKGLIWLFGAAVALSIYNLIQRKLTQTYTAIQTSAFSIYFGTVMLAVFLPSSVEEVSTASASQLFNIIVLGVFSSAVAYITWSKAFSKAEQTSQVSNYMFITPFTTSIISFLIIGEIPDKATLIGGAVILFGIFIFNFAERIQKYTRRPTV